MRKRPGFGSLLIIGGHEDKEDDKVILRTLAKKVGNAGKLVVATIASNSPKTIFEEYDACLRSIGLRHIQHLHVDSRE